MSELEAMSLREALKILNISDYEKLIVESNSRGELGHLVDYVFLAQNLDNKTWFREWFVDVVEQAKEKWNRPESIYQHIIKILNERQTN